MPTKKQLLEENKELKAELKQAYDKILLLPNISLKRYAELKKKELTNNKLMLEIADLRGHLGSIEHDHEETLQELKEWLDVKNEIILNLSRGIAKK